jgi:hypothetical protein
MTAMCSANSEGLGSSDDVSFGLADQAAKARGIETFPHHLVRCREGNRGALFILAGLRSPVIRNRNIALRALAAWGAERWSPEISEALQTAARIEPDDDLKARSARVLAGAPYDDVGGTASTD